MVLTFQIEVRFYVQVIPIKNLFENLVPRIVSIVAYEEFCLAALGQKIVFLALRKVVFVTFKVVFANISHLHLLS